jgi:hypothetical protein
MTAALLGSVVTASLAGSLHCAGMCGGFVAFYAGGDASPRSGGALSHAAYNGGRLASYLLLGALAGSVGAAVDLAGLLAGLERAAALGAGALMIGWGGLGLLRALDVRFPAAPLPGVLRRACLRAQRASLERAPLARALLLGLVSTLLPCGWLYAFAVLAAGTASPWQGMAVLGAFWIGTVPAMTGLGLSVRLVGGRVSRRMPLVSATVLLVLGLLWLAGRATMPGVGEGRAGAGTSSHCAPSAGAPPVPAPEPRRELPK